ncbi:MAG TPA: outer membrane beta-barrel protein [Salinivirgaceae bacterium]|nr:outer membrane beta-barrel protein [Salinivirgaceae bacterium]
MKILNLTIALSLIVLTVNSQNVTEKDSLRKSDSVEMNDALRRKVESNQIEIRISDDPSKSSIVINEDGIDTTRFKIGGKEILILEEKSLKSRKSPDQKSDFDWDDDDLFKKNKKNFTGHYSSMSYGINVFIDKNFNMSLPDEAKFLELDEGKSYEFAFNPFQFEVSIVKQHLGLVSGFGMTWNHYRLDNPAVILDNSQPAITFYYDSVSRWTKNQLNVWSVQVPILLEGQINLGEDKLWIAAGGYGALKLSSKTKYKNTERKKMVERRDYHINPFMYGLTARLGYGDFGFYANYSLNTFFKESEGPELNTLTVGFTLAFN